jgi:RimJ/RimL family protein N-acetyltransferase
VIGSVAVGADDSIPNGLASCRLYVGPDWWHLAIGTTMHDVALNHARAGSDGRISL